MIAMIEFGFGTELPGSKKERMKHSCVVLVFRMEGGCSFLFPHRKQANPKNVKRILTGGFMYLYLRVSE